MGGGGGRVVGRVGLRIVGNTISLHLKVCFYFPTCRFAIVHICMYAVRQKAKKQARKQEGGGWEREQEGGRSKGRSRVYMLKDERWKDRLVEATS